MQNSDRIPKANMTTLHFLRNAAQCFWLCFAALLSLALAGVAEAQSLKPLILKWDYPGFHGRLIHVQLYTSASIRFD
jgi:hypothetical protein